MEGYREQETYKIIGICMEVHRILGQWLLEIVYKNALEIELKELYELNKKLASIVLPVQQMYKDLVEEISAADGGNFFDIKA